MRLIDADELMKRLEKAYKSMIEDSTNGVQKYDMISGFIEAVGVISEIPTVKVSNEE
jgi:hypothetical protein